jgi:hypothetical protein
MTTNTSTQRSTASQDSTRTSTINLNSTTLISMKPTSETTPLPKLDDNDGLVIPRTALIAIVSSLSVLLFLIILLLLISICLKMYRKKEESKLLQQRVKRQFEQPGIEQHQQVHLPPGGHYEFEEGYTDDQQEYNYRVTQMSPNDYERSEESVFYPRAKL